VFDESFEADAYAYDHLVETSLGESPPDYPIIKTAVPSWDNDARRQGHGLTLVGSTPTKFARWLDALIERAQPLFGARVVAINAWNEWSEAAYLEPDVHYGAAYLNAAARAAFGRAPLRPEIAAPEALGARLAAAFGLAVAPGEVDAGAFLSLPKGATLDEDEADRRLRALFTRLLPDTARVSPVVVGGPGPRLASLFEQTHPLWELAVLGDDAALDAAEAQARAAGRDVILADALPEEAWRRAAEMATGDFVWIVEGFGVSAPEALARLVAALGSGAAFAFAQRRVSGADGRPAYARPHPLAASLRPLIDVDLDAESFARRIGEPPVAALWRRDALRRALAVVDKADWRSLANEALKTASAACIAEDLEFSP
jgi:hypothetical protein